MHQSLAYKFRPMRIFRSPIARILISDQIVLASPIWFGWRFVADAREHASLFFCAAGRDFSLLTPTSASRQKLFPNVDY